MLWFTKDPYGICQELGIDIDKRRATELYNLFDGNINGWYYLAAASCDDGTDEAAKWILGAIAARLNEIGKDFGYAGHLIPADYLNAFVLYLKRGKFDRGFAKEIFAELMNIGPKWHIVDLHDDMSPAEVQDWIDNPWPRRVSGQAVMDAIVCDPRFKASSEDELDAIVDAVIAANSDQASKVQDNPKLIQWFVGQVMKAGKGKITAPSVLAKLKQRFAVS